MDKENKIILASSSPRRKHLLRLLLKNFGLKFTVQPVNIDETIPKGLKNFKRFVMQVALNKALYSASRNKGIIIAADTIVVFNGKAIGKPASKYDAMKILSLLSGRVHTVYTGIAIVNTMTKEIFMDYESTKVKFRKITNAEIKYYINTGSPFDKAGAYGIQDDFGSTFVEKINGDYFNVVGLPILKTYLGLRNFLDLKG